MTFVEGRGNFLAKLQVTLALDGSAIDEPVGGGSAMSDIMDGVFAVGAAMAAGSLRARGASSLMPMLKMRIGISARRCGAGWAAARSAHLPLKIHNN